MIFYNKFWKMLILEIYKIYSSHDINLYFNRNNKIIQDKLFFKEIFMLIYTHFTSFRIFFLFISHFFISHFLHDIIKQ
jgi:hypothetical protein